ncbi:MAG: hypothetical protein J5I93_19180, partial [Pirellulaceae bacterium]|nr:hypothetical protein [Pirellulaceae bacterium]
MSRPYSDPGLVVPSWLISLVVHLAGLLVLALLTLPAEDRNLLAVYVGEQLEQREEALVTIETVDTLVEDLPQEPAAQRFEAIGGSSDGASQLAAATPIELVSYGVSGTGRGEETSLVPTGSVLLTVVAPRRGRQSAPRTATAVGGESPGASLANSSSPADQIVHNFILYDIGQLGGEAGQRARADFEALGSDAIESLVRGLNASAYISASCPVIVLESKLRSTLREANDPAKYRFALQHVGRGVVPQAPYAGRLASLRQQLAIESG